MRKGERNQGFFRDNLTQTVCLMHSRLRDEQQRKQSCQEQQLQEAKAREEKELVRQNRENTEKEQQSQLEKEVSGRCNLPVPRVARWAFFFL